jgi:anti-sigma B factor antagonist
MMIHKTQTGSIVTLALSGKLDSVTQADLAHELETVFETKITSLVFDLSALEYISSAGLRVFLSAQKKAKSLGATLKVVGANESVKEIFQITRFVFDE